jgi:hypothetical protein
VLSSVGFKSGDLGLVFDSGQVLGVPHGEYYQACQDKPLRQSSRRSPATTGPTTSPMA